MNEKKNEMIQLIYYDLAFNDQFEKYFSTNDFKSVNNNYNTVAIIGCQSSGKSTLLNNLFNTNFEVMVEDKGRGQTTQGIWVAMSTEYKVMILDCEGTDSKERGEERFKFEHCSSLFALAMADVLIINMWTNDVGRYTASNYGVLKIVFEMNLKLFQQECAKRILIVLRDFDPRFDDKEKITELILNDIYKIWKEIKKPEKFKDFTPDKFFEFEFTTLPHKFYFEENFTTEIAELRKRLIPNSNLYLFRHVKEEKTVPIDGLSHYCKQIWDDIIGNKDLNIPSQKEMLANYKCNEVKDQALQAAQESIDSLVIDSSIRILDNFNTRCESIQRSVLKIYKDTAQNYLKHVYEEIRKQMLLQLSHKIYICFDSQAKKLILVCQKNMRADLEKELKSNDNFFLCAINIKRGYLTRLVKQLQDMKFFENWEISINEYEELFDEIIESQRKYSLGEKKNETIKKIKSVLEDVFIQKLEEISPEFWIEFNQEYFNHFNSILFGLKDYLKEYYKMEDKEFVPYISEIENEIYHSSKKDLYKKMKEISNYAVESFRKFFWYEEGIPRVWNKINESEIDKLFNQFKFENQYIFDLLRSFKLLTNPLKYFNYQKPSEEEFNSVISNLSRIINEEKKFDVLLNENDVLTMKAKYEESIVNILEDAKRRHSNIEKQSIPIWAWVLIVYLGYDDVLKLLSSYWIIPVIILLSLYGTLHAMGMGHIPKMIFGLVKNTITANFSKK